MTQDKSIPPSCADSTIAAMSAPAGEARWMPIETAPKDGTEILAWREDAGVMLAQWCCPQDFLSDYEQERELGDMKGEARKALARAFEQEDWFAVFLPEGHERLEGELAPTHWMPLPPAPTGQSPAAPSQPSDAGEPVAWRDAHDHATLYYRKPEGYDVEPLFAHPQPPQESVPMQIEQAVREAFPYVFGHYRDDPRIPDSLDKLQELLWHTHGVREDGNG